MEKIIVKNVKDIEPMVQTAPDNSNSFAVKAVTENEKTDKLTANFVEVEPGNYAYGYHYHEENEEAFYIIKGEAEVKTEDGLLRLKEGDIVCFPANIKGSHIISNPSKTEKLVYLDLGTKNLPDVVHFTGTNAGMVLTKDDIINFQK